MGRTKTYSLANFSGGWDTREGLFTKDQNRFLLLENYYVTAGRKLRRRPPLIKLAGSIDSDTQGLVEIAGNLYTIAKKGDVVAHTIAAPVIGTLYFDNPDYCTTWTLIQAMALNGTVCALISHTFPGTTVTNRIMLHVFDGKTNKPTFVEDPFCPTSWNPNFPLHVWGSGEAGAFDASFVPCMGIAGSKLWISRPDGNVSFSGVNRPRVWNNRKDVDFLADGEWWYFVLPDSTPLKFIIIPEAYADLSAQRKWSAYVLEYLTVVNGVGTWNKFTEDATGGVPGADFHYVASSQASRFAGGPDEIVLLLQWTAGADQIVRFRMIAGDPPVKIISGCVWSGAGDTAFSAGQIQFEGSYADAASSVSAAYATGAAREYWAGVIWTAGLGVAHRDLFTPAGFPNGLQRYNTNYTVRDVETAVPTSVRTLYLYGNAAGNESDWYLAKLADYTLNQAGFGEATYLNTGNYPNHGGNIKAIAGLHNRIIFVYQEVAQLWAVSADPENTVFQSLLNVGIGPNHSAPVPVFFFGSVIIPTLTGLRSLSMDPGLNTDSLQDNNIGEPIQSVTLPDMAGGCYWPYLGAFLGSGVLAGQAKFFVLNYSRDSKISAWAQWFGAAVAAADVLIPVAEKLYVKAGTDLYYFNGAAVLGTEGAFRDTNDGAGTAYQSKVAWHFNDLEKPGYEKEFQGLDLVQTGIATITFGFVPADPTQLTVPITIEGTTLGMPRIPLGFSGTAVAPVITSTDDSGHELQAINLEFAYEARQ